MGRLESYVDGGSTGLYDTSDGKDEEGVFVCGLGAQDRVLCMLDNEKCNLCVDWHMGSHSFH